MMNKVLEREVKEKETQLNVEFDAFTQTISLLKEMATNRKDDELVTVLSSLLDILNLRLSDALKEYEKSVDRIIGEQNMKLYTIIKDRPTFSPIHKENEKLKNYARQ